MKEILSRLLKVQSELKAPKNQYNSFGKYAYRSAEDILEAVKPVLAKYDLTLTLSDTPVLVGERYYIKATASVSFGEEEKSVTAYAREEDSKKGMDAAQLTGATSTYARKYALCGLFCIDDNRDADATNTQGKSKEDAIKDIRNATSQSALVDIWNTNASMYGNDNDFRLAYMQKQQNLASNGTR